MTLEDYNSYDSGEVIAISMSFVDDSGTATDPTTILLQVRHPLTHAVTETADGAMTHVSTGEWTCNVDTTDYVPGVWYYKVYASGSAKGAKEWAFIIRDTEFS